MIFQNLSRTTSHSARVTFGNLQEMRRSGSSMRNWRNCEVIDIPLDFATVFNQFILTTVTWQDRLLLTKQIGCQQFSNPRFMVPQHSLRPRPHLPDSLAFKKHGFAFGALLILLMNTLNYHLAYHETEWFTVRFFCTYVNDLCMGLCAWSLSFWLIQQVQLRFFPGKPLLMRFLIQFTVVCLPCLLIIILWTELTSSVVNGHPVVPDFYSHTLLIIALEIIIFTFIYMAFDYFHTKPVNSESRLALNLKGGTHLIDPSNILCLILEHGTTRAFLRSGERFTSDLSLHHLEEKLETNVFFRLNRQYIAHRDAIVSYSKGENKKLLVSITDGNSVHEVTISRTKAPHFKKWLYQEIHLTPK